MQKTNNGHLWCIHPSIGHYDTTIIFQLGYNTYKIFDVWETTYSLSLWPFEIVYKKIQRIKFWGELVIKIYIGFYVLHNHISSLNSQQYVCQSSWFYKKAIKRSFIIRNCMDIVIFPIKFIVKKAVKNNVF